MIFYDQETAEKVRQDATKELKKFVANLIYKSVEYQKKVSTDLLTEEHCKGIADYEIDYHLPRLIRTLLYKSGLIYPINHGVYDIILYYDDLKKWDKSDYLSFGEAIGAMRKNGLVGGMLPDGSTHT